MKFFAWVRPAGWLGMVGAVLLSGAVVQAQQTAEGNVEGTLEVQIQAAEPNAAGGGQADVLFFVEREPGQPGLPGQQVAPPAGQDGVFLLQGAPASEPLAAIPVSAYWIGLACDTAALNPTMRAQLGLSEDRGLAVSSVVPDSPAAAAGFQDHDILLSAGDAPLAGIADLVKVVDDAKEQEISIELMRAGKKLSIKVTPAKRPEEVRPDAEASLNFFRPWIARMPGGGQRMRMAVPQPGVLMPQGGQFAFSRGGALPDGTTVSLTKTGSEPAKIVVERGEERYDITEDQLDELPEDLRGPVGAMIGILPFQIQVQDFQAQPPVADPPAVAPPVATPHIIVRARPPQAADPFAEIMKRLDELQKAVSELQAAQQAQQPAPQP